MLASCGFLATRTMAVQWTIYHSTNGGESYFRRGTLDWKGDDDEGGLVITNDELTPDLASQILSSAWYQVKIDTTKEEYVLATVPSCHLRRANFKDEFSFILPRMGSDDRVITSLSYIPLVSSLAPKSCDEYEPDHLIPPAENLQWTSKVTATLDTPGMTVRTVLPKMKPPPGLSWTPHGTNAGKKGASPNGERRGGGGPPGSEESTNSRSFLVKYWYLILPLVLANFLPSSNDAPPLPPGVGEGPAAAAVPAVPMSEGGGGAKRRGKRG
jgi:hypothetical protein